eukprot:XP_001692275.1 predicted protein [Chlamydomonas reinhardtii]
MVKPGAGATRGYRVWDAAAEDALKAGVRKHGLGAWEHIRKDPQFAILSDRTGVQLKDKWRNLVKFRMPANAYEIYECLDRHIDPDEQRTYKPKTQGPWSKKYKRDRSLGASGTASPASGDGGGVSEDEDGMQLALPGLTHQAIPISCCAVPCRVAGIYDRRRYGFAEDGTRLEGSAGDDLSDLEDGGLDGAPAGAAGVPGFGGRGGGVSSRPRRRAAGATSRRARRGSDDEEEEVDPEDDEELEGEGSEMMIECESCAAWAHVSCLKRQMETEPERYTYDFDTSSGSRGRLDGAASPPPLVDGIPLFQAPGSSLGGAQQLGGLGGGSGGGVPGVGPGGTKIFKPIPKLATAVSTSPGPGQQAPHMLARPHPALHHSTSAQNMQRMLEAANPLGGAGGGGMGGGIGGGLSFLHPPPGPLPTDINSLPWLAKSATPPLSVAELMAHTQAAAPPES